MVCQPRLIALQPSRIAHAQVFMANALAAGQQAVVKLLSLHAAVAVYVFKPFG